MRPLSALLLFLVLASAEPPEVVAESAHDHDPFAFFWPSVVTSDAERQRLGARGTVAPVVAGHQRAIAVFSAMPLDADGDRFVRWMRQITVLKKAKYVEAIGRVSSPVRIEDLAGLSSTLRNCDQSVLVRQQLPILADFLGRWPDAPLPSAQGSRAASRPSRTQGFPRTVLWSM